jgi:peptidoglycan/LPS O-acetylase OafA/YrhL
MHTHSEFRALRTFPSLDGLRCFSILAVLYHHAHGSWTLGLLGDRGFLGVDMFFTLSGFLIVTLLLRERERHKAVSLRDFYVRRALRIMPLYYGLLLVLTLAFATVAKHGNMAEGFFAELPYHLTYTSNWIAATTFMSVTWSLSAEEQFYLLWPPIEKWVARPLWVLGALLALSQLVNLRVLDGPLSAWFGVGPNDLPMLRETTFTPILLGVLLAHLLHAPDSYARLARVVGHQHSALALALAIVAACLLFPADLRGWPRLTLHLLMWLLLASTLVRPNHSLRVVLTSAPVVRIGVLSYGMYLLHMPAAHAATVLGQKLGTAALVLPVTLALTLAAAEISFRFYETPFLRLKARFQR